MCATLPSTNSSSSRSSPDRERRRGRARRGDAHRPQIVEFVGQWAPSDLRTIEQAVGYVEKTSAFPGIPPRWANAPWIVIRDVVGETSYYFAHRVGLDCIFRASDVLALHQHLLAFADKGEKKDRG